MPFLHWQPTPRFGADTTPSYSMTLFGNSSANQASEVVSDSKKNFYVLYYDGTEYVVVRFLNDATVDRLIGLGSGSLGSSQSNNLWIDNADFLYAIIGNYVYKINPSGFLDWQYSIIGTTGTSFNSVVTDSSYNVYLVGRDRNTSNRDLLCVVKLNNSGTFQWSRTLQFSSYDGQYWGSCVDSADNIYAVGNVDSQYSIISKYNSSGTLQWQRYLGDSLTLFNDIISDSSDNVYVVGRCNTSTRGQDLLIVKYNSSGTLQWQKTFGYTGQTYQDVAYDISIDSSNNIYATAISRFGGTGGVPVQDTLFIIKLNDAGTVQWRRILNPPGDAVTNTPDDVGIEQGIWIDVGDDMLICLTITQPGNIGSNKDAFVARLPSNGDKTGTYTINGYNYSYSSTTAYTEETSTLTDSSSTGTDSTLTLTVSSSTNTISTKTITSYNVIIP